MMADSGPIFEPEPYGFYELEELDDLNSYDITHVCVRGYQPEDFITSKHTGRIILHWDIKLRCSLRKHQQKHTTESPEKHTKHEKVVCIIVDHVPIIPKNSHPGRKDHPIFVTISKSEGSTAFSTNTPSEACFVFPISKEAQKWLTGQALIDLFLEFQYFRYHYSDKGTGCLYWVLCILSDMIAAGWFEKSEQTRKDLERLEKMKGTEIGDRYYVPGGVGKFLKRHSEPKLKLSD